MSSTGKGGILRLASKSAELGMRGATEGNQPCFVPLMMTVIDEDEDALSRLTMA